jgi:hypothetical protein
MFISVSIQFYGVQKINFLIVDYKNNDDNINLSSLFL